MAWLFLIAALALGACTTQLCGGPAQPASEFVRITSHFARAHNQVDAEPVQAAIEDINDRRVAVGKPVSGL